MKLFLDNCSNYYKFVYQLICLFCLSVLVTNKLLSLTFLEISLLNHFARTLCYIFAFINLCLFLKEKNYKVSLIFMLFAVIGLLCKKSSSSSELLQFSLLVLAFSRLKFEKALQVLEDEETYFTEDDYTNLILDLDKDDEKINEIKCCCQLFGDALAAIKRIEDVKRRIKSLLLDERNQL